MNGAERLRVTAVIIFFNAERFLREAVESVLAQSYRSWELLLVDDGSSDGSSRVARSYARAHPDVIRYLEHEGHANRGMSASRNLGIRKAAGDYIAFLDADDVWLPDKLERQVSVLDAHPDAAMVYGLSEWWFSWNGDDGDRRPDYVHELGLPTDRPIGPSELLPAFFFRQDAAIPGPSSILVRRRAALQIGGFEEQFTGAYEDQAFYAKLALASPVIATDECLDRYRQHRRSGGSLTEERRGAYQDRLRFLTWLGRYMDDHGVVDRSSRIGLRRELWRCRLRLGLMRLADVARRGRIGRRLGGLEKRLRSAASSTSVPGVGRVDFGDLRRVTPISRQFGYDRGQPVDRFYIERFLAAHAGDIRGHVLEIGDDAYTVRFGADRVQGSDVLHVVEGNPKATMVGDLRRTEDLPSDTFDCIILTQTLQFIDDPTAAVRTVKRALKPGGVALASFAAIGQVSRYDAEHWGYYDSFTTASAQRLFEAAFPPEQVLVQTFGNVLSAAAFLYGISADELSPSEVEHVDDDYEVIVMVRAVKP